jgi:ADP-ribose pyrophosphatase
MERQGRVAFRASMTARRLTIPAPRIKPWTRAKTEIVGRHRVFDVVRSEMRLPNGEPCPHPIYTLGCRSWCNVLAITPEGSAIFVWQYRHGTDAMSLEMPGGVVDEGEEPIEGARRELLEETGYALDSIEPLLTVHPNPALQGNQHFAFLGRGARRVGPPKLDATEECEVVLIPVGDLGALLDGGYVTHTLCVSAIATFVRRLAQPTG